MAYKTYAQQIEEHVKHLRDQGLDVDTTTLEVDANRFARCHAIGQRSGRGQLTYKTTTRKLDNGLLGIGTRFRSADGWKTIQTYGLGPTANDQLMIQLKITSTAQAQVLVNEKNASVAREAYGIWINALTSGEAAYLISKNVGAYGIRFIDGKYGRVAIVCMKDEHERIWNIQFLNPQIPGQNNKVFLPGGRTDGLFHCLVPLIDGIHFGVAESYVTAATCFELTGMPMVCAFSSCNLLAVARILRKKYPNSFIFVCADNDRHLKINIGMLKSEEAVKAIDRSAIIAPDFGDVPPHKDVTDWNDLVRVCGEEFARNQIVTKLSQ